MFSKKVQSCIDEIMQLIYQIILLNVLLTSSALATSLDIQPREEVALFGSNVTMTCSLNGRLVASNWSIIRLTSTRETIRHFDLKEYVIGNLTNNDKLVFVACTYHNLENTTMVHFEGSVKKPTVKCTSLTQSAYKCEWNKQGNAKYSYELRTDKWKTIQESQDTRVYVDNVYLSNNIQNIRVNASNRVSEASTILHFNVRSNLKPNVTYRSSTKNSTCVTLKWTTYNEDVGYPVESEVVYKEFATEDVPVEGGKIKNYESSPNTVTVNNLKPATTYMFYIRSRYVRPSNDYTEWTNVTIKTEDSRPTQTVQNLEFINRHGYEDLLVWEIVPKRSQNGNILGYTVYTITESNDNATLVNVTDTKYSVEGILSGAAYNVCVAAYNSAGYSPMNCIPVLPPLPIPSTRSEDLENQFTTWIVLPLVLTVIGLIIFAYRKFKKIDIFIKLPDPKFTEIRFDEKFPTIEHEIFDTPMSVKKTAIIPTSEKTTSNDTQSHLDGNPCFNVLESVNDVKDEFNDDVVFPDTTDETEFPCFYHTNAIEEKLVRGISHHPGDYLQIGTAMGNSGKKKGNSIPFKNDGENQTSEQLENMCMIAFPDNRLDSDSDFINYSTIMDKSLVRPLNINSHSGYIPIPVTDHKEKKSYQINTVTSYVPVPQPVA